MPEPTCARCGLPALGYATINERRYCHSDQERPSCYELEQWDRSVAQLAEGADERRKQPAVPDDLNELRRRTLTDLANEAQTWGTHDQPLYPDQQKRPKAPNSGAVRTKSTGLTAPYPHTSQMGD